MLRNLFFISFIFFSHLVISQEWEYSITDVNMTIQVSADVVTFDDIAPPIGSLLGAFYINDLGEFSCGGYQEWTGDQIAVALWGTESGMDNGFQVGEDITWYLQVDGESYQASFSLMNEGGPLGMSSTFAPNGFGQILDVDFFSSGCSDLLACNYCGSCSVFDDSLCQYPPIYYNCDGECINDSDSDFICDELEIFGCTDSLAANFDSNATEDNGSCNYIVFGCINSLASNFDITATDDDGSCLLCGDIDAQNYYSGSDGTICTEDILNNYTLENETDGLPDCCFYANPGCTDDGSCFDIDGDGDLDECDDSFLYIDEQTGLSVYYQSPFPGVPASNYNPSANILVGVNYCYYFPACQDADALNYGFNCNGDDILSLASENGFSIDFNEQPENDSFAVTYNDVSFDFEGSNSCCLYFGCDDESADNYQDLDGVFYQDDTANDNEQNLNVLFNFDESYIILDPDLPSPSNIISFFSQEDIDGDGISNSLDSDPDGDNFSTIFNYGNVEDLDSNSPCVYMGCMDVNAINYNENANVDNFSCIYYACDDNQALNFNPEGEECFDYFNNQTFLPEPDGLDDCCDYLGCLDPYSVNYNSSATIEELVFVFQDGIYVPIPIIEDGDTIGYENTCYDYVFGCMDPVAENYNDYDYDGESNEYVNENQIIYQLQNINMNIESDLFAINNFDIIQEVPFLGNNTNVNTQVPLDQNGLPINNPDPINSVNPCEYIYGCMNPCFIEYYDIVDYNGEDNFDFDFINNLLESYNCDFEYEGGCTELLPPQNIPTFDDGSCENLLVYGCMDPTAENFNPNANINDCSSCVPAIEIINLNIENPICWDDINGEFDFQVIGGIPPYTFFIYDNLSNIVIDEEVTFPFVTNDFELQYGNYLLNVIDSEGYSSSISFTITQADDLLIEMWESGGWLVTLEGYDNYQWTLNGEILTGDGFEGSQIFPTVSGLYGVTVNFIYGNDLCFSNTFYYDYELFQNSINDELGFTITCNPNPFLNSAIIQIERNNIELLKFALYDGLGKKIWKDDMVINNEKYFIIDNLEPGIYYLYAASSSDVQIIQLMVLD
ncbi:MAG: hypothetical protein CMP49_03505 [Flavobacteriales bacterium]|nr:hypothetical protein [Flavobacteriales bacterium]|tara:strand:- start:4443 stop:7646 length:3204 start_codon:yes stop_codon:yes gene_type:complete